MAPAKKRKTTKRAATPKRARKTTKAARKPAKTVRKAATKTARKSAKTAKKTVRKTTRKTTNKTGPKAKKAPAKKVVRAPPMRHLTPYITVANAKQAIGWYKKAFGAKQVNLMPGPGGSVMHAELMIGNSRLMLSDHFPGADTLPPKDLKGTTCNLHIQHADAPKMWKKAVKSGAKVTMPMNIMFWGQEYGKLVDPYGHSWALARPVRLSKAEAKRLEEEAMKAMGKN